MLPTPISSRTDHLDLSLKGSRLRVDCHVVGPCARSHGRKTADSSRGKER